MCIMCIKQVPEINQKNPPIQQVYLENLQELASFVTKIYEITRYPQANIALSLFFVIYLFLN